VQTGDEALFAYAHSYTEEHPTPTYLKLSGPTSACANTDVTLTVTDAAGTPIESVNIYKLGDGQRELLGQTNANGQFTTAFAAATYELKADKDDDELFSIRSNKLTLVVT
jgi:hypothetical protein